MLHSITWQQFLLAALILSFVWYAAIVLLFYRKEAKRLLNAKRKPDSPSEPLPHRWENDPDFEFEPEESLLGKPVLPEGVTTVEMGAFSFTPKADDRKDEQLGLVPDVLEELKRIFNILAKEDGSKTDFFTLLELVNAKYPKIGSSPNIGRINSFIREHAPFYLAEEELEDLWD